MTLFGNFINSASWEHRLLIVNKQACTFHPRAWFQPFYTSVNSYQFLTVKSGVTTRRILTAPIIMFSVSSKYLIDWNTILPLWKDYMYAGYCLNAFWIHSHQKCIFLIVITTYLGEIMASLWLLFSCTHGSISKSEGAWAEHGKPLLDCFFLLGEPTANYPGLSYRQQGASAITLFNGSVE